MRLPAEWEPQDSIWLSWPSPNYWTDLSHSTICDKWVELCRLISPSQRVNLNAHGAQHKKILDLLNRGKVHLENVTLYDHPNNDVWCRDHGAIFLHENGETIATDWRFNGWGEQFLPYDLDQQIASQMAQSQGLKCRSYNEVLEGGAIESNGNGTIMTTRAVLLNANRNPHLDEKGIEKMLAERLGARKVIWLDEGVEGDDTGGHIDDIARFTQENKIVISEAENGPNQQILQRNRHLIQEQTSAEVIPLPMPEACEIPGWRLPVLPASYVNFLITNALVIVPTFRQSQRDQFALGLLQDIFPSRQVVGVDSLDIVREGGALHCISMQQPLAPSKIG